MSTKVNRRFFRLFLPVSGLLLGLILAACQGPSEGGQPAVETRRPAKPASASNPASARRGEAEKEPINRHVSRLILTRHARCRMDCRHITEREIREILENGTINYQKSEPNSHPDPKYAIEGQTQEGQRLRIVFAALPDGEALVVVTCIELGVEWKCDCH